MSKLIPFLMVVGTAFLSGCGDAAETTDSGRTPEQQSAHEQAAEGPQG